MLNRIHEKAKKYVAVAAVVVAVASLTRFLFSHPICLVDMPTAFSSTGKFSEVDLPPPAATVRGLRESISLEYAE
jgi:hypothetical protein